MTTPTITPLSFYTLTLLRKWNLTDDADFAGTQVEPLDQASMPVLAPNGRLALLRVEIWIEYRDVSNVVVADPTRAGTFSWSAIKIQGRPNGGANIIADSVPEADTGKAYRPLEVPDVRSTDIIGTRLYGSASAPAGATQAWVYMIVSPSSAA